MRSKYEKKPTKVSLPIISIFLILFLGLFIFIFSLFQSKSKVILRAGSGDPLVSLNPGQKTLRVDEEISALLSLDTKGKKVSGIGIIIQFNKAVVNAVSVSGEYGLDKPFTELITSMVDNEKGEARLTLFSTKNDESLPTGTIPLGSIKFKGIAGGTSEIKIKEESEIIGFSERNQDLKVGLSNYSLGSWQVLESSGGDNADENSNQGNVALNLKLKFQGISNMSTCNKRIPVKVKLSGGNLSQPTTYKIVNFLPAASSSDNMRIWQGSVNFDVSAGNGYKIIVKGPKHLQKTICETNPTENGFGNYHCDTGAINLVTGSNALDFSNIYLLVGDLPEQDGLINAVDISSITNNLGSSDQNMLNVADLNYDDLIDTQDYSLAINALSITNEDDGE